MASYRLLIKPSAAKEILSLPVGDRTRVVARIRGLADAPRPSGCERLSGDEKYRVRQGDYRVLYAIDDAAKTLVIVRIGHRRDVYR